MGARVGRFFRRTRRRGRGVPVALAVTAALLSALLALVARATADTAPILSSPDLPWSDPNHQTPTELLASQIASHIAGRSVTVQCEGQNDWTNLVEQYGGNPGAELGYVGTQWNSATGQLVSLPNIAMLSADVCLPLQRFASATTKSTTCLASAPAAGTLSAGVRRRAGAAHLPAPRPAQPGPCYLGGDRTAARMPASFWANYTSDALAILTLAHEAVHLSGVVGGTLASGLAVGDPQAEAKANCYGMQWMPYVAEQLGDSPADAQAIADYFWERIYPLTRSAAPAYWSADCRPGGALDTRPVGATAWP